MSQTSDHYAREVATIRASASARDAADAMKAKGAGSLVVVDDADRPVGMVTDRDVVARVIAEGRDASSTPTSAVMSQPLQLAAPDEPLDEVVQRMAQHGIRRVPIVRNGELKGIVSLDDVLAATADELHQLASARRRELFVAEGGAKARELARDFRDVLADLGEQAQELGAEAKNSLARELESLRERMRGRRS